ncbi:hypothetical protein MR730_05775, partial [bacterium]|nr:hypothetical protein [bacterium]
MSKRFTQSAPFLVRSHCAAPLFLLVLYTKKAPLWFRSGAHCFPFRHRGKKQRVSLCNLPDLPPAKTCRAIPGCAPTDAMEINRLTGGFGLFPAAEIRQRVELRQRRQEVVAPDGRKT